MLSEEAFRLARRLAQGPHDSAHISHADAALKRQVKLKKQKEKLLRLRAEQAKIKTQAAKLSASLGKAKDRIERDKQRLKALAREARRAAGREQGWVDRVERLTAAPLVAYGVPSLHGFSCVACDGADLHLIPYPSSVSPRFSRLIVLLCATCGFGCVPEVPFDLDEYYRTEYGSGKPTRVVLPPEEYFSVDGALHQPGGRLARYFERSREQLALIHGHKPHIEAMLDFGSGPGYALFLSEAATKHAIEPDDQSAKYLDYIGATRTLLTALKPRAYDVILASHAIEHIVVQELFSVLGVLRVALRDDGLLCIEVPYASLGRAYVPLQHEPHTLFFSPDALVHVVERAGFEVVERAARTQISRQILAEPLVNPSMNAWSCGLQDGLIVLARPTRRDAGSLAIPSIMTRVLRPRDDSPA